MSPAVTSLTSTEPATGESLWTGPVGDPENDNADWAEPGRTIAKAVELGTRDHVVFGGSVPEHPDGMMMRSMAKNTPAEYRDRRDWDAIRAWADGIADALRVPTV